MSDASNTLSLLRNDYSLDSNNADIIGAVMNDADDVFGWIQRGQKSVTLAALDQEESNNTEKVAELDADFRQLLDLEHRVRNQKLTMATIRSRISQGEKIRDLLIPYEAIQLDLTRKLSTEEAKYLTNEKYLSFRQNIWNINHPDELMPNLVENDDDDDIVMGSTKISLKCPITTTWLVDPVTSSMCKHTFSKAAIMDLLRQNHGQIDCPLPGCNRKITANLLLADDIMADRVRRSRAREEQKASSTQYFEVE